MYEIEFNKGAIKQLNKLPNNIKNRIDSKILNLSTKARPNGVKN